ncbi:hypothetical protein SAMN05216251_11017 [Actinacidiphila alni]|uniref:Uncharacterized protein n=1 Tax=Actinacidiphila alni TaxID=380248 RepID=A0A1I2H220_9ACTN|nr:hypothetical protein [Actinacidiphila alni]SFF23433.1 hypothetical protein SAMN05216251_11017 [Actinacidiphila alni]
MTHRSPHGTRTGNLPPAVPAAPDAPAGPPVGPTTRQARRRATEREADPFDPMWVDTELRAFADRALRVAVPATGSRDSAQATRAPTGWDRTGRGEATAPPPGTSHCVNDELLEALWPWALRTAHAQVARLPPGADRDAVHGEILWEVFQAVRRIDWRRYDVWPALLKARMRAAWSTAARAQDTLTRGERQARSAYLARSEAETQRLGRTLTSTERDAIAKSLRPSGGTAPVVLGRRMLSAAADPDGSAAVLRAAAASAADDDPAAAHQRAWLRSAVRTWVAHDLPAELRNEVTSLLERDEADHIRQALLRRLSPYATALHQRVGE